MALRPCPVRRRVRCFAVRALGTFVVAALLGGRAEAQLDTITIETSEGSFTVELFDFPDVVAHAEHFRQTQSRLSNAFFHRGDKLRFCDDTYCFYCVCNASLMCQDDPNARTCETEGDEFWIVDDDTQPSPYLESGRFFLDENYAIDEHADDLPAALQGTTPTFSNTALTVAYVRKWIAGEARLTSEWVVNLENNPELDDPFPDDDPQPDGRNAYLVFGVVRFGDDVLRQIAQQRTYDATADPTVIANATPSPEELEQVPVFDTFVTEPSAGDAFIDPCAPGDTACLTPACSTPSLDGQTCEDPRCVGLVPLTEEEQGRVDLGEDVPRFCSAPALPAFPVIIPEPRAILVQITSLVVLAGLARRRRHARR